MKKKRQSSLRGMIRGIYADALDAQERVPWEVACHSLITDYEESGIYGPTLEERIYAPEETATPRGRDDDEMTLQEIGDLWGVSRERIRSIQNSALAKLRKIYEERGIE